MAHTLDILDVDGKPAAAVLLLASLYAARVRLLEEAFSQRESSGGEVTEEAFSQRESSGGEVTGEQGEEDEEEEEGDVSPFWLRMLVQSIESHGGRGFGHSVPQSVMTADTWTAACGE